MYLATASGPGPTAAIARGDLGQMITYKSGNRLVPGATFAIDNGRVRLIDTPNGKRPATDPDWSEQKWLACLDRYAGTPGCLFAAVPDEVGDAAATDALWPVYAPMVKARGYAAAYVLQNGCTGIPVDADAVFTGGDDAWKEQAGRLVAEAKRRGLPCHMGRVNTLSRLRLAARHGYDSVDGTTLAWGADRNLPQLLGWLQPAAPSLWGVA